MAGTLGIRGDASAPPSDEGFEHWVIGQSFSMLAPMCRIGLVVITLMLLVVDPILYANGIWGNSNRHMQLFAWHALGIAHFLCFLIAAGVTGAHVARRRCLTIFLIAGAALFSWFAFISWSLSGDLSTYAIFLLTMVCVFGFPGRLIMALNIVSTASLIWVIYWIDERNAFYTSGAALNLIALAAVALLLDKYLMRMRRALHREKQLVEQERARADKVLYNALPMSIADELKSNNTVKAEKHLRMAVLFVDIVGFTRFSASRTPDAVVQILNEVFTEFDTLVDRYDVEKIKTIGDAYMVIGKGNVSAVARLALDMISAMQSYCRRHGYPLDIRAGIHVGPTIAGVIGLKRFLYDVWGDAVNTASRMESTGQAGRIQVSKAVHQALVGEFHFEPRGCIMIKGKGAMPTWFLLAPKQASRPDTGQLNSSTAAEPIENNHRQLAARQAVKTSGGRSWANGSSETPSDRPKCADCAR